MSHDEVKYCLQFRVIKLKLTRQSKMRRAETAMNNRANHGEVGLHF